MYNLKLAANSKAVNSKKTTTAVVNLTVGF